MSKHTQGPWRIGKHGRSVVADHPVPDVGGSDSVEYYGGHLIAESISPSNVPLIAAATELLEALQDFADMPCETKGPEDMEGGCCRTCRARDAIAKATGADSGQER